MPRIQEPTRRRRGGGGITGVRGGPGGFYQRRGHREDKPYWPEVEPSKEEENKTATLLSATPPLLTQAATADDTTKKSIEDAATASATEATNRASMLKKKNWKRKKRDSRRSSYDAMLMEGDDDNLAFGRRPKPTKSLTPKSDASNRSQERAKLPLVTPVAAAAATEAAGVDQSERKTPEPTAPPNADSAATTTARNHEPWQSPHPHSQESPFDQIKIQDRELEEQTQKYDLERQYWKRKCQEQGATVKSLQQKLTIDKEAQDKEHTKALEQAVEQERTRITLLWDQDKTDFQQSLDALQQQVGASKDQVDKIEYAKFQELGGHHVRMQLMAKSLMDLSRGHREVQEENKRQTLQLQTYHTALAASQRDMRTVVSTQKQQQAALAERERYLVQREQAVLRREIAAKQTRAFEGSANNSLELLRANREQDSQRAAQAQASDAANGLQQQQQQQVSLPQLLLNQSRKAAPAPAAAGKANGSPAESASGLSFQSSTGGSSSNNNAGSPLQPLQFRTLSRAKSSPRPPKKKRSLRDVIPTYNFLGFDLNEAFKSSKSKKPKLSRKNKKVVMDSP